MRRGPTLGLILLLWSGACTKGRAERSSLLRTDSAGVEIVVASPPAERLGWTFRELWRVGAGADDTLSFVGPRLAVDASAGVYLVDFAQQRLIVLEPADGSVRSVIGREGDGPGEFRLPGGVARALSGEVWVLDFGKRGLLRFDAGGEPLAERPLGAPPSNGTFAPASEGVYVEFMSDEGGANVERKVVRVGPDASQDTVFFAALPRPAMVDVPGCGVRAPIGRLFEPIPLWTGWGATLVVGRKPDYRVDIMEDGQLVRSLRLDLPARPLTHALAREHYAAHPFSIRLPNRACTADADAMIEAQGLADRVPALDRIEIAPAGTIWVRRGGVGDEPRPIDVWTADGDLLGTLGPDAPLPAAFISDDRIVAVEQDELDVPSIVAYEIIR